MNLPFIDWAWRSRGEIAIEPPLTTEETFARLRPLVDKETTECDYGDNTLTYIKGNPAAQDRLATFSQGTLTVEQQGGLTKLLYDVKSNALALVLLAPLFFVGFAQIAVAINQWEDRKAEVAKAEGASEEEADEEEEPAPHHWIDEALGAPAPETLEQKKQRMEEEGEQKKEKLPTTPSYVLAGLFLALYVLGRFLEPYLFRRTLKRALNLELAEMRSVAPEAAQPGRAS
ncbi:hypothetical protein [Aurantiacibacter suaedae]|uniref:hypothetical protein n=1 Tax=Aurantiacibacter suaedae TaxID=2545755 RepID=UPI0010F4853F|nr:hypothetical protein [Aurantiacibacter suaedae]